MRWLTLVLLAACGPDDRPALEAPAAITARTCSEDAILTLLNASDTTAQALRDLGLRSSAAYHLMHIRSGTDGVHGTSDDVVFTSMDAVDAVPYVGPATLDVLENWAEALCSPDAIIVNPTPREIPALMMGQTV